MSVPLTFGVSSGGQLVSLVMALISIYLEKARSKEQSYIRPAFSSRLNSPDRALAVAAARQQGETSGAVPEDCFFFFEAG